MFNKLNIYIFLRDFNKIRAKVERVVVSDYFLTTGTTDEALNNLENSISWNTH